MKKHLIQLTENENEKIQSIKEYLKLKNVNEVFCFLIKDFNMFKYNEGFTEKEKDEMAWEQLELLREKGLKLDTINKHLKKIGLI